MNQWLQIGIGFSVIAILIIGGKVILQKQLRKRKEGLPLELLAFETAIELNKPKEVNSIGTRLVNNPNFEISHLRKVMELLQAYKQNKHVNKEIFKTLESAILNRQLNWGLFASRYTIPEEYEKAKRDLINLP